MELLVTLRKRHHLEKITGLADGIIIGRYFCNGYHYTDEEFDQIHAYCREHRLKFYVAMDTFISENDRMLMEEYFDHLHSLDVDGIYFHDLGIYERARAYGMVSKLIYDGKTVLCNSLDTAFLLDKGIDSVVISRELTLNEISSIVRNNPQKVDLQIFGHLRMSYSKRKFLTNYFREIKKEYDYIGKESLSLVEEQRNYRMPIVEDEYGTCIYTDYILEMFDELPELRPYLKRGIIDTLFIEDDGRISQICRDYRRLTSQNRAFLKESLYHNYPDDYSSGYLYQKTNITKDEQD